MDCKHGSPSGTRSTVQRLGIIEAGDREDASRDSGAASATGSGRHRAGDMRVPYPDMGNYSGAEHRI
jgi:hypothetical protein